MLNLAMTADDKQVAVRLPRVIRLYDITPHNDYRELKLSIPAPSVETQVMSFSRDGRTLAAASQLKEDAYVSSFDVASAKRKGSVHFKMAAVSGSRWLRATITRRQSILTVSCRAQ
jgi:hypothetical protein